MQSDKVIREKIPLQRCREIMIKNGVEYTDDELLQIRDFLYKMADMVILHYEQTTISKRVDNNTNNNSYETQSIPLHPGEYRRAS